MNQKVTYVIGHKNPDTDTICSAIAYAELKRNLGKKDIRAARAGNINTQTEFVLDYFNLDPPGYLPDVHPRVKDVMTSDVITIDSKNTLNNAYQIIKKNNLKLLPVTDSRGNLKGTLSLMDISKMQIDRLKPRRSQKLTTSIKNLEGVMDATQLNSTDPEREFLGNVVVGAMCAESFRKRLQEFDPRNTIVVVGNRPHIQEIAIRRGIRCLIVTGGENIKDSYLETARDKKVSVLISPYDTAQSANLIFTSMPIHRVARDEIEVVKEDELLDDVKEKILLSYNRGMPVVDQDERLTGILTRTDLLRPPGKSLILVDHNELRQAVDGAGEVEIKEIIDHHRLGNLSTLKPIFFLNEPVGATSTLVAELYKSYNIVPEKEIAGILMGGIISDTLMLKSPTSTKKDEEMILWLSEIADMDYRRIAMDIFKATSSLSGRNIDDIVEGDFKEYELEEKRIAVGQVEVVGLQELEGRKIDILDHLEKLERERAYSFVALMVTDILTESSLLLFKGSKRLTSRMEYPVIEPGVAELKGVLSRKKQVMPYLLRIFK